MLDYLMICAELSFKKLIFVGAVGALKAEFDIGDICTPIYSIAGTLANTYLKDSIRDYVPFEKIYPDEEYVDSVVKFAKECGYTVKKASVFCTDSIVMEHTHLEEIRSFGTDLIEMETSVFYAVAKLMESEREKLINLFSNMKKNVMGQDSALKLVSESIKRARAGIKDPNKPIGSFILNAPVVVWVAGSISKIFWLTRGRYIDFVFFHRFQ